MDNKIHELKILPEYFDLVSGTEQNIQEGIKEGK